MSNTRREFLQASTALAMGIVSCASIKLDAESTTQQGQTTSNATSLLSTQGAAESQIQVPTMKFGGVEISRLVLGVNPFYGWAHYNNNYSKVMSDWYTQDKVCEVLHRANRFGINAFNYVNAARAPLDLARFQAEGGKMHLIPQFGGNDDPAPFVEKLKPIALQRQGEVVDVAYREGKMDSVREWCKRVRDLGIMVGVGTHKPEVIEVIEGQAWDVDFYAGCVYNRTRTPEEWRQIFHGELPEMPGEVYLQSDPARMYKVMRQTPKPCFAFKILAAGRIGDYGIRQAFQAAFENIKPIDGVYVGVFPRTKDEVKENAEIVYSILTWRNSAGIGEGQERKSVHEA